MQQAVLTWAVEGAKAWYNLGHRGLLTPQSMRDTAKEHRNEVDLVAHWLEECTEEEEEAWTAYEAIMESYIAWCHANNMDGRGSKGLSDSLKAKGYQSSKGYYSKRKKSVRGVKGFRIIDTDLSN